MDVVSLGPLFTASLLWRSARGSWAQTVVCKATWKLLPDESPLARDQEPLNENDNHWDDDPARSLFAPSDLVPCKPRADVLLVGKAFAPRSEPVRSVVARIAVGAVDKSIEVHCDRAWTADGKLVEGAPFTSMSLFYERAGGGPETWNPVGISPDAPPDAHGAVRIANLQPHGFQLKDRRTPVPPVGFGPIAPHWPERARRFGRHAAWAGKSWRYQALPDDLDPAWFNAAPSDQQLDVVHEDARIVLENLHRERARLTTTLAGVRPRVYVEPGGPERHVHMVCDTLWIDTDRAICTLTWRGVVPLQHPEEPGRIVVEAEERGRSPERADMKPKARETAEDHPSLSQHADPSDTLPLHTTLRKVITKSSEDALPFRRPPPPLPLPVSSASTAAPEPLPPAPVPAPVSAPVPVSAPAPVPVSAPAPVSAPVSEPAKRRPRIGAWVPPGSAPEPASEAPSGSALEASNAAAGVNSRGPAPLPSPARAPTPSPGADVIELLWLDPEQVARIRRHPAWKKLIAEAKPRPRDDETGDAEPREKQKEAKDRQNVLAVLRSGDALGAAGLADELATAMKDGTFTPPLALVEGVLEFPFDEKETLKATMALVAPFTPGDKRLKEQSDIVGELLQSPWLERGSAGLEGYTARLREAFAQPARALPPGYLEAHTERLLLEQRHYQKRTLLGQEWIRALLTPLSPAGAGAGAAEVIPTYLPERLAKELPLFQRFRARAIAEARLQLDQFEAHSSALRVVALGRLLPTPPRR